MNFSLWDNRRMSLYLVVYFYIVAEQSKTEMRLYAEMYIHKLVRAPKMKKAFRTKCSYTYKDSTISSEHARKLYDYQLCQVRFFYEYPCEVVPVMRINCASFYRSCVETKTFDGRLHWSCFLDNSYSAFSQSDNKGNNFEMFSTFFFTLRDTCDD